MAAGKRMVPDMRGNMDTHTLVGTSSILAMGIAIYMLLFHISILVSAMAADS